MVEERVRRRKKDGRKNSQIIFTGSLSGGGGGNGIAGLLVLGGAVAVAGYVAVSSLHSFITKRIKAKTKVSVTDPESKPQQLSLVDNCKSQYHNDDHENGVTPNNDGDAVSACYVSSDISINQALILENTDSDVNTNNEGVTPNYIHLHQETVLCDDFHPESVASSSNENEIEEECVAALPDNHGTQPQEDEPQQNLNFIQTYTKDDDEDGDDYIVLENEKQDDSSKTIEGTTLNSIDEKAEQDFKGEEGKTESDIQTQEAAETGIYASADATLYNGTNMAMNVTPEGTSNEKANFLDGLNYQPSLSHSFQLTTWLMPMLLQVLVLLLVLHTFINLLLPVTK
ncbi:hypothetical protein TanjilG_16941 [Lupinus angustifolius]|uniref:uncharacterized protein LOC109335340 n=1 Tax=Lupinus angustifolius TaxID=3871 RepID=UPI00090EA2CF|nr:PREDICTED: uncharacterized protein LOC109335340 [Lupinus angustifolius]OIV90981.1 hypothetical protein TanjilG_16941 [Lupinus angustifolius]